ncbi:MAG: 30S ribosomal protein S13 [Candidatus Hadarchaeales archaeon]
MTEEFRHIVRVAGKDLPGEKKVLMALTGIKGVGLAYARAVMYASGIDPNTKLGNLKPEQVELIENIMKNPTEHGIPVFIVNRRKDYERGGEHHMIGSEVDLTIKADIGREKKMRSRRGIRHELGLPVRGQRTKTTGRKGLTVGVMRKEVKIQTEQAAKEGKAEKKEQKAEQPKEPKKEEGSKEAGK